MASRAGGTAIGTAASSVELILKPSESTTRSAIEQLWWLTINRRDQYLAATTKGAWYVRQSDLARNLFIEAATGRRSLGVQAVSQHGTSRWVCLDADDFTDAEILQAFAASLDPAHTLVEESRRGVHVWRFFEPVPWRMAHLYGMDLLRQAGISCEVYPRSGGGGFVRLPGSRHPKDGKVYGLIDPRTGEPLGFDHVLTLSRTCLPPVHFRQLEEKQREIAPGAFKDLVDAFSQITRIRVYGENRASGLCPFHDDRSPSFGIDGDKFRCFSSQCRVYGDIWDLRRYLRNGTWPPTN